ncbi:hypothetical protein ACQ859_10995 [Roseateles chitinivorans]|uniref:hypothetical protein n=1 Tax=Roseateles chitinivorans TaxID=2917965 RepID=UPI003D66F3E9
MSKVTVELLEWEARLVLLAMAELKEKWRTICNTTTDEDIQADYGNDLVELGMAMDSIKEKSVAEFGEQILVFDRTPR